MHARLAGELPPKRTLETPVPAQVSSTLFMRNNAKLHCACMKRRGRQAAPPVHRIRKSADVGKRKFPD